ncbi:hypothetical protein POM88_040766 [Heracleum sosnowskyi]|uniref:Uncharacterized protein n=1 Tax=Heracleum sosnowskyi TaxID=360622 RepID=A0AAD8M7N7_9APIA|nr:hypothetical protein POM88_040766 [Heracleum sosnowskyi]
MPALSYVLYYVRASHEPQATTLHIPVTPLPAEFVQWNLAVFQNNLLRNRLFQGEIIRNPLELSRLSSNLNTAQCRFKFFHEKVRVAQSGFYIIKVSLHITMIFLVFSEAASLEPPDQDTLAGN